MPTPVREQILQAITTRVAGKRGFEQFDQQDLPITIVIEGDDTEENSDYDFTRVTMPFTVGRAAAATGNKTNEWKTQANELLADIVVAVYTGGEDLGGLAESIVYAGGSTDLLTDGARGVAAQAFFEVRFKFIRGNPYSQTL